MLRHTVTDSLVTFCDSFTIAANVGDILVIICSLIHVDNDLLNELRLFYTHRYAPRLAHTKNCGDIGFKFFSHA